MLMKGVWLLLFGCLIQFCANVAHSDTAPVDVRPNHWARSAVIRMLQTGTLQLQNDHKFHGDAKVTRLEVVQSIARLAKQLEVGSWKPRPSIAISESVQKVWTTTDWKHQQVRRYTLAVILTRLADYAVNGIPRPKPGTPNLAKSITLEKVSISLPKTHPAFESLTYLANNRMLSSDSPLLKPDLKTMESEDLSRVAAQMVIGLNDLFSDQTRDVDGNPVDPRHGGKPKN